MPKLNRRQFLEKIKATRLLALDVDGVLTDDSIFFGSDGFEMKKFNISDGLYIVLAMRAGLEIAIVSGRYSPATDTRMKDLGVKHVLQEMKNKVSQITPLLEKLKINFEDSKSLFMIYLLDSLVFEQRIKPDLQITHSHYYKSLKLLIDY